MVIHLKEAATRTDRASQNREQELKDAEEQELKVTLSEPTTTVPVAGAILGLSKNKAYAAAARGEIPTLRFGRRLVVPTMLLKRMLGMEAT